jgi:autotransporter-associated beta strand protein
MLSADSSLTGILFQTDANSISQDLKTAVTDIDTALTITTTQGSLYTTGNSSGGTLTANITAGTQTFSGLIANGLFEDTTNNGLVSLTKTGSGGLTINTMAQTYSGDTTISAGTLTLSGAATIANSGNIYLSSGTTLDVSGLSSTFTLNDGQTLKGTGSVTGDIAFASTLSSGDNLQDGSSISPGGDASNYGVGKIAVTGAGTWNAGTTYHWEINNLTGDAGDADADNLGWDYLTFTGALAISGSASNKILIDIAALDGNTSPFNQLGELGVGKTQRPALNRSHKSGYEFPIVYADGGITGFNAEHFEIDYMHFYEQWDDPFHIWNLSLSGDNKTLSLTYSAVPEPSTYVMVSGLLLLPAVTIYRRLKKKKAKEAVDDSDQGS